MCGCDCCKNSNPTCYDPTQRGSRKWLCRCDCGNCIARVLDAHESWVREDERGKAHALGVAHGRAKEAALTARILGNAEGKDQMRRYLLADDENTNAQAYRQALSDAVEAVKAMNGWEESGSDYPPFTAVARDDAVAAIEALGGAR